MSRKPPTNNNQPTLHPVLESALGCVDVQVEEELARYRRQKARQQSSQPEPPKPPVQGAEAVALPQSSLSS
ncbi:hypothetical protein PN462_00385, partial [Spirulina sp. CS-785/01]